MACGIYLYLEKIKKLKYTYSMSEENKIKILLVEDEVLIAMDEKMKLEDYGYTVITANDGEKAIRIFKEDHDIGLILMDIELGRSPNGPETTSLILKEREIPVIFLSSHKEPEIVRKTEKITSYGYIVKDSDIVV
ncbi:MAG: response regulator, partial [Brevinematales bacterium]